MKCINRHTSCLNKVAPGHVGEFDPTNRGVKIWLACGKLEALAAPAAKRGRPKKEPEPAPEPPPELDLVGDGNVEPS